MNIRLKNKNIVLEGEHKKVFMLINPAKIPDLKEYDIVLGTNSTDNANSFCVYRPGEYEVHDVLILAMHSGDTEQIDLWAVDIDHIRVVYLAKTITELSKKEMDMIGLSDILIVDTADTDADLDKQVQIIDNLEPEMLIPLTEDKKVIDTLAAEVGAYVNEPQPKIKIKSSDLNREESTTGIFLLAN